MFNVVLVEPEIPPNTGNVIRLCANTGARLHLIEPLGFPLDDAQDAPRRARLSRVRADARPRGLGRLRRARKRRTPRACSRSRRAARRRSSEHAFQPGDWFVFGAETRGLARRGAERFPTEQRVRLPMRPGNRSLNLSNTVAVVVFEAWRQTGFEGGA